MFDKFKQFISGALVDIRPIDRKLKDFKFEEVVSSPNSVVWTEKKPEQYRKFPIFNQGTSGSCVMQTQCKEMGVMRYLTDGVYVHFSVADGYQRRMNKPWSGMLADDARRIASQGITLEALVPSQGKSDKELDSVKIEQYKREVGAVFKVPNFLTDPVGDIDAVASIIQTTGKAVMVWFYFTKDEWTYRPTIKDPNLNRDSALRHSVAAVDYTLVDGKKCLVIEDSWGLSAGVNGQRIIDEDFYRVRNYYAGHLVKFRFSDQTTNLPELQFSASQKPVWSFTQVLEFTPEVSYNVDVLNLQKILQYEGIFPSNVQPSGYYGAITAKSVLIWQKKNRVASDDELNRLGGRVVGPKTIEMLNKLYG